MQTIRVDQLVGRTLGEYQIERLLGHGQLGAAYMARQVSQGRPVMMIMFNSAEAPSAQERDQCTALFAQERASLIRLTHPYILPTYDFGEQSGYFYLVTAFVKGASLRQVLKQQGRFTPHQTLEVLKQLAAGLDYAHSAGVVHGVLSLSNVLISTEHTVYIAGFGLRTLLEAYGKRQNTQPHAYLFSRSGTLLGSPEHVSPERLLGGPVVARSDIYALGVMLFELLSDTLPFSGANPLDTALKRIQQPVPSVHAVCPDVAEGLDLVIGKALERDPTKRYQRAGESAAAFELVLTLLEAVARFSTPLAQQLV
jgi:serine/threonine protein kinase